MAKVKRTPGLAPFRFSAWASAAGALGGRGGAVLSDDMGSEYRNPVMTEAAYRTLLLRHSILLVAREGRLCQLNPIVPITSSTLCSVMILHGGSVRIIQTGVMASNLKNMLVKAGLVLALVAVVCVLKNSVNRKNGSSSTSHRCVKISSVSKISSKLFLLSLSESDLLRFLLCPVQVVLESGEYRRPYMPAMRTMSTTMGPANRRTSSL